MMCNIKKHLYILMTIVIYMSDRVISVFGTKGGIGKTSIAVSIGYYLAEKEGKTLLIELDSNFSVSTLLNINRNLTLYEVVVEGKSGELFSSRGMDILSSDGRTTIVENKIQNREVTLQNLWKLVGGYEWVVVDHHNSFSILTTAILQKSNITVIPLTPDKLSLGAYIHTHKVLDKLKIKHRGVANRIHYGFFGVNKDDLRIVEKARENSEMFRTLLPEVKRLRNGVYSDPKFRRKIEDLVEEIKEVM